MTKSEFIQQIENPQLIDGNSIVGTQQLLSSFPYCQSLRLTLTKAFHASENINFEGELRKTAAFAGDREKLHKLLFATGSTHQVIEEKEETPTKEEVIKEVKEDDSQGENPLEKQILSSAISSSILLEVSDEIPELEELSPKKNDTIEIEETSEDIQQIAATDTFNQSESHSFSEWIHFFADSSDNVKAEETENLAETTEVQLVPIEEDEKAKVEFYSASKMARLSVKEDDDLITETLANIYAQQGNLDKAISAFEKLQLKYPEKRVYFAGRIKEIQNQLNS